MGNPPHGQAGGVALTVEEAGVVRCSEKEMDMADFKASYGEMEAMSGKLDTGREEIGDILRRLKSDVDRLLGDDFKTQHASGKFGEGYTELTTGLEKAIEGISDMGESLRKMQQAIKDTDQALAGN
jgi:uncharacterized protein YukE